MTPIVTVPIELQDNGRFDPPAYFGLRDADMTNSPGMSMPIGSNHQQVSTQKSGEDSQLHDLPDAAMRQPAATNLPIDAMRVLAALQQKIEAMQQEIEQLKAGMNSVAAAGEVVSTHDDQLADEYSAMEELSAPSATILRIRARVHIPEAGVYLDEEGPAKSAGEPG